MSLITTIIDGLAPNPSTGLGGANEGYIQGFQDDILTGVAGGVANKADGQCLVTENDPNGMSVLVADGVVYVPNADYIAGLASTTKFYRVVIKDEDPLTIASNGGATWRLDGIDVVIDKEVVPNEYGSNVATLVVTQGTGEDEPAVPDNGYRLAVVQVDAGETQIVDADIQDVRTQISIDMDVLSTNIVTKTDTQTLTNKTLTSPVINTSFSGTAKATASDVTTGTEDAKIVTPKALADAGIGVSPVKASGAEITTGTDDAKYATSKALADAGVNTRLLSKVILITRDMTASSGDVSYTGVGFKPTSMIGFGTVDNGSNQPFSMSAVDSSKTGKSIERSSVPDIWPTNNFIYFSVTGGTQVATVKSYDNDGFTLTWVKGSSPTGSASVVIMCFK